MTSNGKAVSGQLLDHMQYQADPLADATMRAIMGDWQQPAASANQSERLQPQWKKLATVSRLFQQWHDNRGLIDWRAHDVAPEIAGPLQDYVRAAQVLPDWADHAKIERAETLFIEYGALSCTLLFCASLPECYVVPDLADVLHVAGQLERHTDHRIRATAAMIFPVMMQGGMTRPDGAGVAQVLKVRLIHATIRNLILRGSPQEAVAALGANQSVEGAGVLAPLSVEGAAGSMYQALFAHGWKLGEDGLPCNQEELAYTLLTFSYVFLRGLRKLGVGLSGSDEEAYLHTWNVMGHVLGITRELMPDTMAQAAALFAQMQSRVRADKAHEGDPRPALARALIECMKQVIPLQACKPFPLLMTRYLCGSKATKDLRLNEQVGWFSRALFAAGMGATRLIDTMVRLALPEFSIARLITRVVGYQLMTKLLMDQTRPLKLPEHVLNRVNSMMGNWGTDPKAPRWMNALEDKLTVKGSWTTGSQH
jgi:ER-bound oxygenase mpaB/B'/Rubber oxygenase, catalytic domain